MCAAPFRGERHNHLAARYPDRRWTPVSEAPPASNDEETASETPHTAAPGSDEAAPAPRSHVAVPSISGMGEAGITVGLVTLLLFLRLFAVARWDWRAAASLADSFNFNDALSIALGTLFERPIVTGVIITVILPLAFFRDYWLASSKISKARAKNWFLIIALLVTAFVLTMTLQFWWVFAATATLTAVLIITARLARHRTWGSSLARVGRHLGILLATLLLIVAATIETPWVQREVIITKEGEIDGYVLEADPGFLKVMTQDRDVLILPDSDVVSRTLVD